MATRGFGVISKTYYAWASMKQRCNNPRNCNYNKYGARGITVCERWSGRKGYDAFIEDMGECPPGLTLERKDTRLGYSPENCIWATYTQQRHNRIDSPQYRQEVYLGEEAKGKEAATSAILNQHAGIF